MNASEWIMIGVGAPGSVSMLLLIWDRVKTRHRREAFSAKDLDDLRDKVRATAELAAEIAKENIACAQQRTEDSRRIGVLEVGSERVGGKVDRLREEFVIYSARNDEAHKSVTGTLEHQTRAIEQLQAQIRMAVTGSADQSMEIVRHTRARKP